MFVRNTFLAFEEEVHSSCRRSHSAPPAARVAEDQPKYSASVASEDTTVPPSMCSSAPQSPPLSPRAGGTGALEQLLARANQGVTMMMQNIPKKYTQKMLFEMLVSLGLESSVDFFYLPTSPRIRKQTNLGYCFINFTSREASERFAAQVEGTALPLYCNKKVLRVCEARVQGFAANIRHLTTTDIVGSVPDHCLPMIRDPSVAQEIPFRACLSVF
mmetsp:Transcript_20221/g.46214  ORF Transcript_20221/g.46214 Transcript_20221/m.46214 type:complete len:216 (-) Transcript_20221:576-1223(-)